MLADQLDHVIGVDPHRDTHALAITRAAVGYAAWSESAATDEIGAAVQSNQMTTKTQPEGSCDHEADHHDPSHRRWSDAGKRRRVG
jgi:hypothetical protein